MVFDKAYRGCQMAYFQSKNSNLVKFRMDLQWKMLVYFMDSFTAIRYIYFACSNLVYFMDIRYILPVLECCTKKNLATLRRTLLFKKEESGLSSLSIWKA
jgi:hypothetical protein